MPYREAKHINEDIVKRRTSLMSRSSLLVRFNTSQSFLGALSSQLPNELINLPVTVTSQNPMKFPSPQASGWVNPGFSPSLVAQPLNKTQEQKATTTEKKQ